MAAPPSQPVPVPVPDATPCVVFFVSEWKTGFSLEERLFAQNMFGRDIANVCDFVVVF